MICSVNPVVMHAILPLSKLQSYRRLAADSFFIDNPSVSFLRISDKPLIHGRSGVLIRTDSEPELLIKWFFSLG